ncbi:MAG: hypothetical protein ABI480_08805 [Chitinophagaceae bacterium]
MQRQLKFGKYVIVDNSPILFPIKIIHREVTTTAQSAGYFMLRISPASIEVICWGESTTLNLRSNQSIDAQIIEEFISNLTKSAQYIMTDTALMKNETA